MPREGWETNWFGIVPVTMDGKAGGRKGTVAAGGAAKIFLTRALEASDMFDVGTGSGPVYHFLDLRKDRDRAACGLKQQLRKTGLGDCSVPEADIFQQVT